MMRRLYFHRDSKRGINGRYKWLEDELRELRDALKGNNKEATENELAVASAWRASLANITGTDLERAAINKCSHKCPKCQQSPCQCTF